MRLFIGVLVAIVLTMSTSQASTKSSTLTPTSTTNLSAKTAIKKEPLLVKSTRIPKLKILRSNPHRALYYVFADDTCDIDIDDESKITGYRKRDLNRIKSASTPDDPDGEVSEEIRWKLFLARQLALSKYRANFS